MRASVPPAAAVAAARRAARTARGREAGYVTAETALAIPALVLLTLMLTFALGVACAQIRCVDAAHAAARAAARGEPGPVVTAAADAVAPAGARTSVGGDSRYARVSVRAEVRAPGRLLRGLRFTVTGSAVAAREPGAPGMPGTPTGSGGPGEPRPPTGRGTPGVPGGAAPGEDPAPRRSHDGTGGPP